MGNQIKANKSWTVGKSQIRLSKHCLLSFFQPKRGEPVRWQQYQLQHRKCGFPKIQSNWIERTCELWSHSTKCKLWKLERIQYHGSILFKNGFHRRLYELRSSLAKPTHEQNNKKEMNNHHESNIWSINQELPH